MKMTQDGGKVVSLTHQPLLPPGNTPGTHFYYRLRRPQGHTAIGRIISMKDSNDTIWNRTSDLPKCSTAGSQALLGAHHFLHVSSMRVKPPWGLRRTHLLLSIIYILVVYENQLFLVFDFTSHGFLCRCVHCVASYGLALGKPYQVSGGTMVCSLRLYWV